MKGVKKIMSVFYLMNKDTPALRVELEAQRHICKEVQPINLEAGPIYLACQEHRVSSAFTEWMRLRAPLWEIASGRKEILRNYADNLSDQYWLRPQESDVTWKDITPFRTRLQQNLLQQDVIHADETPVQVHKEKGRKVNDDWIHKAELSKR